MHIMCIKLICGSVYHVNLNDIRPNKSQNTFWKSISTSLKAVKSLQKIYFGKNIVDLGRFCRNVLLKIRGGVRGIRRGKLATKKTGNIIGDKITHP